MAPYEPAHPRTRPLVDGPPRGDEDPPLPPSAVLGRFGARKLDPTAVVVLPGQRLRPTAYLANRLLVRASAHERARPVLNDAARRLGLQIRDENQGDRPHGVPRELLGFRLRLVPDGFRAAEPDAWRVLQEARAIAGPGGLPGVGLDHLLFSTPALFGSPYPYHSPNPYGATPITRYAEPGYGGTLPVAVVLAPPVRRALRGRRPVVAVLDTGCGRHDWLATGVVRDPTLPGAAPGERIPIGYVGPDPEDRGDITGPMDGVRDPLSGHGTFICGLVRQVCPDADLLALRVVRSDGVIAESELVTALAQVHELARRYAAGDRDGMPVDVVSLSLGYYHEATADVAFDSVMFELLDKLGQLGVSVVTSAGNDATRRPMYPAAFTPHPGGPVSGPDPASLPVMGVGALNPDTSVALFSNSGPWVVRWEPGAAVVSTLPTTFDSGLNPLASTVDPGGRPRRSLDPDNFSGGFALGTGTSYAAPVFAARLAAELIAQSERPDGIPLEETGAKAVERGWRAIAAYLKL